MKKAGVYEGVEKGEDGQQRREDRYGGADGEGEMSAVEIDDSG